MNDHTSWDSYLKTAIVSLDRGQSRTCHRNKREELSDSRTSKLDARKVSCPHLLVHLHLSKPAPVLELPPKILEPGLASVWPSIRIAHPVISQLAVATESSYLPTCLPALSDQPYPGRGTVFLQTHPRLLPRTVFHTYI